MKNIPYTLLLCSIVTISCRVHAQEDSLPKSILSLRVGPDYIMNKDEFQSPFKYSGTNIFVSGSYGRATLKAQQLLELNYSSGKLQSRVSPTANNQLMGINYDYLFIINRPNNPRKFSTALGVGLHSFLSSTNYLPKEALSKNYLSGSANLMLSGSVTYHINKRSHLNLRMSMSVIGASYRPDFEINGETLTEIAPIGKNNLFDARLEYSHRLGARLDLIASYHYHYFHFNQPRPVAIMRNGLFVGLKYRL